MSGWFARIRTRLGRGSPDPGDEFSEEWLVVTARARSDMEARQLAVEPLRDVVDMVSSALLKADPVALAAGGDADEYDSEAETVVLRLSVERRLLDGADVLAILHEEFVHWFGEDLAGPQDRYEDPARRVNEIWREYLASGD